MVKITLPDGAEIIFGQSVSCLDIAAKISPSLAKNALIAEVEGELKDLSFLIEKDSSVRILTPKDPECLEILRHDASHIMAEAVKELFPEVQVTIGPATADGFYYDFSTPRPFTPEDLIKIEERMGEIVKRDEKITREVWGRDRAVDFFKSIGENYKAEIIESIPENEEVSLYRQGDFIDLCRGPHFPSTGKVKHFKLTKLSGSYWRGDSKNEALQRVYGTAFFTEKDLEDYLLRIEEAAKRDHRKIGAELDLFHFQEEAPGMVFWHDKGLTLYKIIEDYIRSKIRKENYIEVKTPLIIDKSIWEASGHWEKFGDDMFSLEIGEKIAGIKPMNCPLHVQIFRQGTKSYKDLPLRMAEFGLCHRNESSGSVHGLMRVRAMVQDDAHIFCTEEQIIGETVDFCRLLVEVYKYFGFDIIKVKFSDRPKIRAGSDETWDKAEKALKEAASRAGFECELNPGDGAFYGPKLEFHLKDAIGREWQCGTLQMDFVLPERLDASYTASDGSKKRPVMLHRAILGSLERFTGILIENYAGKFPLKFAPVQVAVATITSDLNEYATKIFNELKEAGIRTELDISAEKVNYKIRNFSERKIPIIAIIGKKEKEENNLTLRILGSEERLTVDLRGLLRKIAEEVGE